MSHPDDAIAALTLTAGREDRETALSDAAYAIAVLTLVYRGRVWTTKYGYRPSEDDGQPGPNAPYCDPKMGQYIRMLGRNRMIAEPRYHPRRLELTPTGSKLLAELRRAAAMADRGGPR